MVCLWAESISWQWNNLIWSDWLIWKGFPSQTVLVNLINVGKLVNFFTYFPADKGNLFSIEQDHAFSKRKEELSICQGISKWDALLPDCPKSATKGGIYLPLYTPFIFPCYGCGYIMHLDFITCVTRLLLSFFRFRIYAVSSLSITFKSGTFLPCCFWWSNFQCSVAITANTLNWRCHSDKEQRKKERKFLNF